MVLFNMGFSQIFCPASIDKDSFYSKATTSFSLRIENHVYFDKMLCHEIVEKRVNNTPSEKLQYGCGFGGYPAANFAFSCILGLKSRFLDGEVLSISKSLPVGFHNDDISKIILKIIYMDWMITNFGIWIFV
jgi:esterase/lipase superfamily enzyme